MLDMSVTFDFVLLHIELKRPCGTISLHSANDPLLRPVDDTVDRLILGPKALKSRERIRAGRSSFRFSRRMVNGPRHAF